MLALTIIGLSCGLISIFMIILEIDASMNSLNNTWNSLHGIKKIAMLWLWPKCVLPVLLDVGITLSVIWLFSMGGMIGMMISLMASAMISSYLYFRGRKKRQELAAIKAGNY